MKGVILVVFSTIAISLTNAHYRKKPTIEIFEIRQNQLTKNLQIKPVKLQYNLESEESQASKLSKLLLSFKKTKTNPLTDIVEQLNAMKKRAIDKKAKQPVVMVVSPEYLNVLDANSDGDSLASGFLDETRTKDYLKLGSKVLFNIVPPKKTRKTLKKSKLPAILRTGELIEDRTNPPPPRGGGRPYVNDYNDNGDY